MLGSEGGKAKHYKGRAGPLYHLEASAKQVPARMETQGCLPSPSSGNWGGGEKLPWVTLWEPTQSSPGGPPHGDICDSALEATTSALSHSHRRAKGALFQYPKSRPFV